jgi:hypothetical protein
MTIVVLLATLFVGVMAGIRIGKAMYDKPLWRS